MKNMLVSPTFRIKFASFDSKWNSICMVLIIAPFVNFQSTQGAYDDKYSVLLLWMDDL